MEVLADGPARAATVISGPLAELVPDPVEEYPMVPVGPGAVRRQASRGRDLGASDVLRAPDRGAVRPLRGARHPEGRLMELTLLIADPRTLIAALLAEPTTSPETVGAQRR